MNEYVTNIDYINSEKAYFNNDKIYALECLEEVKNYYGIMNRENMFGRPNFNNNNNTDLNNIDYGDKSLKMNNLVKDFYDISNEKNKNKLEILTYNKRIHYIKSYNKKKLLRSSESVCKNKFSDKIDLWRNIINLALNKLIQK